MFNNHVYNLMAQIVEEKKASGVSKICIKMTLQDVRNVETYGTN
jgi:hypothetical protein